MTSMTLYHRLFFSLCLSLLSPSAMVFGDFDHSLYDALLKKHVSEGLVDYGMLKEDKQLDAYLKQLSTADLVSLSTRNEKVAFWTNAYNAYTLKLIVDHYPVESIMEIKEASYADAWQIPIAEIGGETYTLDQIENGILRPKWPDSRIHYALVCAARSCPQLRSEAYTSENLDQQLDDQARWFMQNRNTFDLKNRKATLSKVYEWYAVDFGDNTADALKTLIPYIEPELAKSLSKDSKKWGVSFSEWNWQLNKQE